MFRNSTSSKYVIKLYLNLTYQPTTQKDNLVRIYTCAIISDRKLYATFMSLLNYVLVNFYVILSMHVIKALTIISLTKKTL